MSLFIAKPDGFSTVQAQMTLPAPTPKTLIGASVLMLLLAAVFGSLNSLKIKGLRNEAATATAAREAAVQRQVEQAKQLKLREEKTAAATGKNPDSEKTTATSEAELVKMQSEKTDLQAKLAAAEAQVRSLQQRVVEAGAATTEEAPGAASPVELQAQLDDARRQLENAEREKQLLADKLRSNQERSTPVVPARPDRKIREPAADRAGIRGTVMAVNQAYNFVVLNLGGRNGVENNSEMLVVRNGTLLGKIRISSVEPATSIGDIISSTLARGVQVQPGDVVIYAGSNH